MTEEPLVSVVIPTHFRNEQLAAAIRSVSDQTYSPLEVIVVDDSGERHAEPVCEGGDVTYIAHARNRGGNPARNTGIEAASGEYVQLLDDDDELAPEKIEKQVELLQTSDDVGVVYCGLVNPAGEEIRPNPEVRGDVYFDALRIDRMHPCLTGTMLIDSDVLGAIFPLTTREAADDIGTKVELAKTTEFDFVDEVLYYKGESESHRADGLAFNRELVNIIGENIDGYRAAPSPVYRDGMKKLYKHRGIVHVHESIWSARAIKCFYRAVRYTDRFDPLLTVSLLTSIFGYPGYTLASTAFDYVRLHFGSKIL
jgi:glycosyltransferase involved in cell wall biosynthesis